MKILKQDPLKTIFRIYESKRGHWKEKVLACLKKSPLLGVLALLAILYYKYHKNKKVSLHFGPTERNLNIVKALQSRLEGFSPTFYLPFALMKCALVVDRKLKHLDVYRRMKCKLPDGEVLQLDWYPRHYRELPVDTPVVFFVPGLFGTSLDIYSLRFCEMLFKRLGWRSFVYNRRGFISPVKGKQLISYNCFQDWRNVLANLRKAYPSMPVYLVGVSMGAMNVQKYLIDHREDPQVAAAVTISSPFDASKTNETISKSSMLDRGVCQTMVSMFRDQLHHEEFVEHCQARGIDPKAAVEARTMTEFHQRVTCKDLGHTEPVDFYESLSSHRDIQQIQVPVLSINSMDDPLIPPQNVPLEAIRANHNLIQVLVSGGGHIEYFHGLRREFWAYDLAIDYLKLLHESTHTRQENPTSGTTAGL